MREYAYDYDNVMYLIARGEGSDILKFGFSCNGSKEILLQGGEDMLTELYKGILTHAPVITLFQYR